MRDSEPLPSPGIHPTAVLGEGVELGEGVAVGPCVVIGDGARIGDRSRIGAHAVVGRGCVLGPDTVIHPRATLYPDVVTGAGCVVRSGARLGPDGFGFAFVEGRHRKIPQVGGCVLGDGVEVGENATIDRGSIGPTVVEDGCRIAALVHVGHNAHLGRAVVLGPLAGVAGSAVIGDGADIGGQVAIVGHLTVGRGARVAWRGGVTQSVPEGEAVAGTPARPLREARRAAALFLRLPKLLARLRALERAVPGPSRGRGGP